MQTISLNDVYNVRPDIFIKGAEDRLHVQYAGKNFILRLQREIIDSLYDCLGRIDGFLPMGEVLAPIPVPHHASALKFINFLETNKAAFKVTNAGDELALAPVKDTLSYLRQYGDDSAGTFRRFEQRRVLIVGGGYALMSAVKTFARLGARALSVIDTGADGHAPWSVLELQQCFEELRNWPDATLHLLPNDVAQLPTFDDVLHLLHGDSTLQQRVLTECSGAEQLVAQYANGNLCLLRSDDYLRRERTHTAAGALPGRAALIAGATAALFFFDNLCHIRRIGAGRYHYYHLSGESILRFGRLHRLQPISTVQASESAKPAASELERLLNEPLFPLHSMVEHTDPASYIKLYTLCLTGQDAPATLAAAGRDRHQCQASLLAQLAARHGLWFDQSAPAETAAARALHSAQRIAEQVVQPLRAIEAEARTPWAPPLTPHESYVAFCINAAFGERVRWYTLDTGDTRLPACAIICAGTGTLYLPHAGELSPQAREAGLLALYTALWQLRLNGAAGQDVLAGASPFQLNVEPVSA